MYVSRLVWWVAVFPRSVWAKTRFLSNASRSRTSVQTSLDDERSSDSICYLARLCLISMYTGTRCRDRYKIGEYQGPNLPIVSGDEETQANGGLTLEQTKDDGAIQRGVSFGAQHPSFSFWTFPKHIWVIDDWGLENWEKSNTNVSHFPMTATI